MKTVFSLEWYRNILSEYFKYLRNVRYPNQIFLALGVIKNNKNSLVLDSGVGRQARLSLPLLKEGLSVVSLDLSEQVIKIASSKLKDFPNSFCIRADALHLPFKEGTFDLIICCEVIEYLSSPVCFLIDAHRVLKKRGKIMISTPNASGLQHFFIHVFALMFQIAVMFKIYPKRLLQANCRAKILTLEQLKSVMDNSCFNIVSWIGEIGIFRLLDPFFSRLGTPPPSPKLSELLLILDIQIAEKIPFCLHSGWSVICVRKSV